VPLEEPQDVVGVVQRERVNDQPAHPEFRVAECRARVYRHRVQLEVGDLQGAEPRRAFDLGGRPLEPVEAADKVVEGAVAEPAVPAPTPSSSLPPLSRRQPTAS